MPGGFALISAAALTLTEASSDTYNTNRVTRHMLCYLLQFGLTLPAANFGTTPVSPVNNKSIRVVFWDRKAKDILHGSAVSPR
jgi:hypothetical protein